MNADKNGFQMSNGTHQYALFGAPYSNSIKRSSTLRIRASKSLSAAAVQTSVIQRWKNGRKLAILSIDGRRSKISSPAQAQRATNSSSSAISLLVAKMSTLMGTAEKTEELAIRPPAQMSGSQAFAPKQATRESNARNAAAASSPS